MRKILQDNLQQEIIASVKKSLTFDILYQRIRPDISPFIAATSTLPLKNLDDWDRLIRDTLSSSVSLAPPQRIGLSCHWMGSLSWLDMCHPDGFRRERALRTLCVKAPNSFLFALAARRLNDWVPQVRDAACEALPLIAELSDADIIVDVLFITLPYWNSWGRMGDAEKKSLLAILAMDKVVQALKKRLISSTSGPVATIFMQAGRTGGLDTALREIAELSVQPTLRAKAWRCLLDGKFVWAEGKRWQWIDKAYGLRRRVPVLNERRIATTSTFLECLKRATLDRSAMVRRVAGEMLIKELDNLGEDAVYLANLLAADLSPSVAERGRFALADLAKRE